MKILIIILVLEMVLFTYSLHTQPIKKSLEICKHKTLRITLSLKNVQSNPKTKLQDEERFDINEDHCENFDKNILAKPKSNLKFSPRNQIHL